MHFHFLARYCLVGLAWSLRRISPSPTSVPSAECLQREAKLRNPCGSANGVDPMANPLAPTKSNRYLLRI